MAFKVGDRVRARADTESSMFKGGDEFIVEKAGDRWIEFSTKEGKCQYVNTEFSLVSSNPRLLIPAKITELLHEAEHDIFVAEQRKHDLLAALELVNKGWKVELPDA